MAAPHLVAQLRSHLMAARFLGIKFLPTPPSYGDGNAWRRLFAKLSETAAPRANGRGAGRSGVNPLGVNLRGGAGAAIPRVAPTAAAAPASGSTAPSGAVPQAQPRLTGAAPETAALVTATHICANCELAKTRRQVIFGEGNWQAKLFFIGEAPGKDEDFSGRPYGGAAGEMLTNIIEKALGVPRRDTFITYAVKCRPPGNRPERPEEIAACAHFLRAQIAQVRPQIIIALGGAALKALLAQPGDITEWRGKWLTYEQIPVMPLLPPNFLLQMRRGLGVDKTAYDRQTFADLQAIKKRLQEK
jgi:DNA polymerase